MGQHHRREDHASSRSAVALPAPGHAGAGAAAHAVPHDAPPAGLGYPPPTAYRPDPVTGIPTPPHAVPAAPAVRAVRAQGRRRAATRAPLTVAVAGAAVALVGMGSQLPGLVDAVRTSAASAPGTSAPTPASPAVAGQCAQVVADAIDDTITTLGRIPNGQWAGVVAGREDALAATYGEGSAEQRAYAEGVDDVVGWLHTDPVAAEDWNVVTHRVAGTVASTCGS
ncbi:hypothetical protein [Actinomycetospora lemnae]|uniref:Uncharacterized protein n=1 Tax=Actinomycetospora lemnae TaxID=3019891 RepID=A0ABT5SV78_9PSEU|nr:hypothetical protein [Actinomycetospora sp. DW7H6]MDD7966758.1 hypothetical protein [Actinomycetospora sp. DW7H6]